MKLAKLLSLSLVVAAYAFAQDQAAENKSEATVVTIKSTIEVSNDDLDALLEEVQRDCQALVEKYASHRSIISVEASVETNEETKCNCGKPRPPQSDETKCACNGGNKPRAEGEETKCSCGGNKPRPSDETKCACNGGNKPRAEGEETKCSCGGNKPRPSDETKCACNGGNKPRAEGEETKCSCGGNKPRPSQDQQ